MSTPFCTQILYVANRKVPFISYLRVTGLIFLLACDEVHPMLGKMLLLAAPFRCFEMMLTICASLGGSAAIQLLVQVVLCIVLVNFGRVLGAPHCRLQVTLHLPHGQGEGSEQSS